MSFLFGAEGIFSPSQPSQNPAAGRARRCGWTRPGVCALSGLELCRGPAGPQQGSDLHEGHFPPIDSPCIVRAFTSPSPQEALHKGRSWLGVPHLTQWDSLSPLEASILLPSFQTKVEKPAMPALCWGGLKILQQVLA